MMSNGEEKTQKKKNKKRNKRKKTNENTANSSLSLDDENLHTENKKTMMRDEENADTKKKKKRNKRKKTNENTANSSLSLDDENLDTENKKTMTGDGEENAEENAETKKKNKKRNKRKNNTNENTANLSLSLDNENLDTENKKTMTGDGEENAEENAETKKKNKKRNKRKKTNENTANLSLSLDNENLDTENKKTMTGDGEENAETKKKNKKRKKRKKTNDNTTNENSKTMKTEDNSTQDKNNIAKTEDITAVQDEKKSLKRKRKQILEVPLNDENTEKKMEDGQPSIHHHHHYPQKATNLSLYISLPDSKKKKKRFEKKMMVKIADNKATTITTTPSQMEGETDNIAQEQTVDDVIPAKKIKIEETDIKIEDSGSDSNRRRKKKKKVANTSSFLPPPPPPPHLPVLHSSCSEQTNKRSVKIQWKANTRQAVCVQGSEVEVIGNPFPSCYITNLLENEQFLEGVKKELQEIPVFYRNNDLFEFHQTGELRNISSPYISALRHFLYHDMREWLQEVTGLSLLDTVDMSSSRYSYTDVLLCHDDVLEGRLIAYILYLVPPWGPEDGGTLDLFSSKDNEPQEVVKSLLPKNNAFAFFRVSKDSFHQVSEVLSKDKTRLSINGWYHSAAAGGGGEGVEEGSPNTPNPPLCLHPPLHVEENDVYSCINPLYLNMKTQKAIRKLFCDKSEIRLENFLQKEAYQSLSRALLAALTWHNKGPANRRCYEVLDEATMPDAVIKIYRLIKSEAFFILLSQLTGLKLHRLAPADSDSEEEEESGGGGGGGHSQANESRCVGSVQRWGHGSYTLMTDDCKRPSSLLHLYLFANVSSKWSEEMGGQIVYADEEDELLRLDPQSNNLNLVYCEEETQRFTKYINARILELPSQESSYHSISCVYQE